MGLEDIKGKLNRSNFYVGLSEIAGFYGAIGLVDRIYEPKDPPTLAAIGLLSLAYVWGDGLYRIFLDRSLFKKEDGLVVEINEGEERESLKRLQSYCEVFGLV